MTKSIMIQKRWALCLSAIALIAGMPATAQITHLPAYELFGVLSTDKFGYSTSVTGDVNGDGHSDIIVGAYTAKVGNAPHGSARVFSGIDGTELHSFFGQQIDGLFGYSTNSAGDVNNDGIDDFIVGSPLDNRSGTASGTARVFSGTDGSQLYELYSSGNALRRFGEDVASAGDVNNDGYEDLIVGASEDDEGGDNSGRIHVYSGFDGSELYAINGLNLADEFGNSVSGAGDINHDGFDDFIVGAHEERLNNPYRRDAGAARVYSGQDGSLLHEFFGSKLDRLGRSVAGGGDIDNDGTPDLIVSAGYSNYIRVYSGTDGSILYQFNGSNSFGKTVENAGDLNNDGYDDVIVGAPHDSDGKAFVYSGFDGSILYSLTGGYSFDRFGSAVSGAGDLNGDGIDDFIVGASDGNYVRVYFSTFTPYASGDLDGDGLVTNGDIAPFVLALTDPQKYQANFPGLDANEIGDMNGDGLLTNSDIAGFVAALTGGASPVPEPNSLTILGLGGLLTLKRRR